MSTPFERKVAGDALQLVSVVREYGPDTIHRLIDRWGPDHTRAVCIALAAAVDQERTPSELWGWLGPVDNRTSVTFETARLFTDPNRGRGRPRLSEALDAEAVDLRAVNPRTRQNRESRRRRREREKGAA